jgi:hypothetical protein
MCRRRRWVLDSFLAVEGARYIDRQAERGGKTKKIKACFS